MTKQCLWRLDTGVCCNVDFSINSIQCRKFQTSLFGIVTVDFFVDGFPFCFVSLRWIFVETLRWIFCSSTHFQCLESLRWNSFRGQNQGFPQCIPSLSWKIITLASASRIQNRKLNSPNLPSQWVPPQCIPSQCLFLTNYCLDIIIQ